VNTSIGMRKASIAELVSIYAKAAVAHGTASEAADPREANRQFRIVISVYREVRRRGPEAQRSLLELLDHSDQSVRCWAATHALEFAPESGEPILRELARGKYGPNRMNAFWALKEWRRGTLRFPWSVRASVPCQSCSAHTGGNESVTVAPHIVLLGLAVVALGVVMAVFAFQLQAAFLHWQPPSWYRPTWLRLSVPLIATPLYPWSLRVGGVTFVVFGAVIVVLGFSPPR
jgi:hypothetical protein